MVGNGLHALEAPQVRQGSNPCKNDSKSRRSNRRSTENGHSRYVTNPANTSSGCIRLQEDLPSRIGHPVGDAFHGGAVMSTSVSERVKDAVHAQAYYSACRKLYHTLPSYQKLSLQAIYSVLSEDSEIPELMCYGLSGIGTVSTALGEWHIQDAPIHAMRWLYYGLLIDPRTSFDADEDADPFGAIWRDKLSHLHVKDKVKKYFRDLAATEYVIDTQVDGAMVKHETAYPTFDVDDMHLEEITHLYPAHQDIRRAKLLYDMSLQDFKNEEFDFKALGPEEDWNTVLGAVGLHFCYHDVSEMIDEFETAVVKYIRKDVSHLRAFFSMSTRPIGRYGCAGQIVQAVNNLVVEHKWPLSDADLEYGYIFRPCVSFALSPLYTTLAHTSAKCTYAKHINSNVRL